MPITIVRKGGSGSGFHGHAGRPGKQGGSQAGAGGPQQDGIDKLVDSSKAPISKSDFKKKYPALYEALDTMAMDVGYTIRSKMSVVFADYNAMDKVNATLTKLRGKTLGDILPKGTNWNNLDETPDNDALETFVIGEHNARVSVKRALGADGRFTDKWLEEVFDGKYTDTFFK